MLVRMFAVALAFSTVATTANAGQNCKLYWDEVAYSAHRHDKKVVELTAMQREAYTRNWNTAAPPTRDSFAHVYTVATDTGVWVIMLEGAECVTYRKLLDFDTFNQMLVPLDGG